MNKFWLAYIAAALVGSAVVWVAAPFARPALAKRLKEKAEPVRVAKAGEEAGSGKVADGKKADRTAPKPAAKLKTGDDTSAGREEPPALLGIFRVTSGKEKASWGVIRQKTNFYDADGKRLGEVPGGVIIDFIESRKSSKGTMVLCKFLYKGKIHGPYLVKRTEMSLFTGKYTDLSENQRSSFEEYYRVRGLLEERKDEVMQQIARKNPHYHQYKGAYDKYIGSIEKAQELKTQRDKSDGLQRSRLDDQLRRIKTDQVKLKSAYDKIHTIYKDWKTANASKLPDVNDDSSILEFRRAMNTLRKDIPGLAY